MAIAKIRLNTAGALGAVRESLPIEMGRPLQMQEVDTSSASTTAFTETTGSNLFWSLDLTEVNGVVLVSFAASAPGTDAAYEHAFSADVKGVCFGLSNAEMANPQVHIKERS